MAMMPILAAIAMTNPLPASDFRARERDWRMGAVVYQVFVDRFAPPENLQAKRNLYSPPRRLRLWTDLPTPGTPPARDLSGPSVWSHELDFWGGDLNGVRKNLDYIHALGADIVYLTPIFSALTNHKYDAQDYHQIAPEFGTLDDFRGLVKDVHQKRMKIVLDGVFNHMGKTSPRFQRALADEASPDREWYFFDRALPAGYRAWAGVPNLPAINLESPKVRAELWGKPDSVVKRWLKEGIDGWRLDVALELGPRWLEEITKSAHASKKGSLVVGEINGYPSDWFGSVDGVYNFAMPNVVGMALKGNLDGAKANRLLADMAEDAGIENLLRSWLHIDNHDTERLAHLFPAFEDRALMRAAQFTLPGSPVVYYGSEFGMPGAGDPANRRPMDWDTARKGNADLDQTRRLIQLRKQHAALRIGDFKTLQTDRLIAYTRTTDRVGDAAIVVMNPTGETVTETFSHRIGWLMSWGELNDALGADPVRQITGLMTVTVPPKAVRIFVPSLAKANGYSPYDRQPGGDQ